MKNLIDFLKEDPVVVNVVAKSKSEISLSLYTKDFSDNDILSEKEKKDFEDNLYKISKRFNLEESEVISYEYNNDLVNVNIIKVL